MSTFHESASAAVADRILDESEAPVVREILSQDGELNVERVQLLDESLGPDVYGRHAVLSLADVSLIDARCASWLLAVHERFLRAGGRLVVHSVRPEAREILEFLRLDLVLYIAENEAAALRLVRAGETVGDEC